MIIKVCGMRDADNIREVSELDVDMMGFIGAGNNPMVGMTVAVAVAINEKLNNC